MFKNNSYHFIIIFGLLALVPLFFKGYTVFILPQYILFGILAMSLAFIWGNAGILSFGQASFFAIGGYAFGLLLKFYPEINHFFLGSLIILFLGFVIAAITGYFLFSAGVKSTYFVLATLALSILTEQLAVTKSNLTGGWNGLFVDRINITIGDFILVDLGGDFKIFYLILAIALLSYLALNFLEKNKIGKVLKGIRENEDRMLALGYKTSFYKTLAFGISGAFAALAGALYATHANFISPSVAGVLFSTEVVVWVAIGGRYSLLGAFAGGIIVSFLSNYLSTITPEYWQLFLGIVFIITIIFFKDGLAGIFKSNLKIRNSNG
jgi:urea transport system permease protein